MNHEINTKMLLEPLILSFEGSDTRCDEFAEPGDDPLLTVFTLEEMVNLHFTVIV